MLTRRLSLIRIALFASAFAMASGSAVAQVQAVSVTANPTSGPGPTSFTLTASYPSNYQYIDSVYLLLNWSLDGAEACYVQYSLSGNALYLRDDQSTTWLGGFAPGSAQAISNSQCSVNVGATTVTGAGSTLTVALSLSFNATFPGQQNVYLEAIDQFGDDTGHQQMPLTYTAYTASSQLPSGSVTPSSGAGATANLVFHASDVNGYRYISQESMLIAPNSASTANACYLIYFPDWNNLYLVGDDGVSWLSDSVLTPGTSGSASNSQCTVSATTGATSSGNDLGLPFSIQFTAAFAGSENLYQSLMDKASQSTGWQAVGSWVSGTEPITVTTVPSGLTISADGVAYSSPQTFQWTPGSTHTIGIPSPQSGNGGTQYLWASWSDGGPVSHTITVPSSAATYTASLTIQYYLSTSANAGGTISPPSGWYNANSQVQVTASANAGYRFTGFTGSTTSATNPLTVTMSGPVGETATFALLPTLTIASSHTGSFTQGQTGATYSVAVSNTGAGPTNGAPVVVTESVPSGLIAISIAGSNWDCIQPAGPCARSDALASGASYDTLTMAVDVMANAPATVTNQANVSGGGSASATSSDPTNVSASFRYANPLAFATSASVVGGVATTLTVTYTDDNGPAAISSGQVKIDNCYLSWDSSGNIRVYGQQNGEPDATGVLV